MSRSAAPSAVSARICSRSTSIRVSDPTRRRCGAVTAGDTDPATSGRPSLAGRSGRSAAARSAAARARATPARLISVTLSGRPWSASQSRLAPNVLAWMMSAPAIR